jgi:hypothetical protein
VNTKQAESRLRPEPVGAHRPQHPLFLFAHGCECLKESVGRLSTKEREYAWTLLHETLIAVGHDGRFLKAIVQTQA